jgi:hypothetical protein
MRQFKVGDVVISKVDGLGEVVSISSNKSRHFSISVIFYGKVYTSTFTPKGHYQDEYMPSKYDIKHASKLEKYLYETEA